MTGDRLVTDAGAGDRDLTVLSLDRGAADPTALEARYGSFSVYVAAGGDDAGLKALYATDPNGNPIPADRSGIHWRRVGSSPPAFQAAKRYRNVVLQWQAGTEQKTDARFARLDAALGALVRPGNPPLPPEDQPCEKQGIDLAGGTGEGTCKDGAQTVVVTSRGRPLEVGATSFKALKIELRKTVGGNYFGQQARARGRFAVVRVKAVNHGDEPLRRLALALRIGDREYAESDAARLAITAPDPLPLQPGGAGTFTAAFDLPTSAAKRVKRQGALVLSTDSGAATLRGASTLGWYRFAKAQATPATPADTPDRTTTPTTSGT